MPYLTIKQRQTFHQMSLEDLYFGPENWAPKESNRDPSGTVTRYFPMIPEKYLKAKEQDIERIVIALYKFNANYAYLREQERHSLYHTFKIPKRSGGWRTINEPKAELMAALRVLDGILAGSHDALYHTAAHAYIGKDQTQCGYGRSTVTAMKRHQLNKSRWFEKTDIHDFFGSTTLEFMMRMFSVIFPFSEVVHYDDEVHGISGRAELEKALELCTLDGGLPQGTPISPRLTNIIMIPLDHAISQGLNRKDKAVNEADDDHYSRFCYTRYADDFQISNRYGFDYKQVEEFVNAVFKKFGAPYELNPKKTRYGSSAGSNWNLGLMLNKDNDITVGWKRKRNLRNALFNYAMDHKNGVRWDADDINHTLGEFSYVYMVESERFEPVVKDLETKFGFDVIETMRKELTA